MLFSTEQRLRFLLPLFLVLLLISFAPIMAQDAPQPEAVGLRFDAPTYALHGPYWVGARDYFVPEGDGHFWVTVWYPALNPEGLAEEIIYPVSQEEKIAQGIPEDLELLSTGHALANADPDLSNGPYPVVVYSPGLGTWRQSTSTMLEHLASQGFVVMAMEHRGETVEGFWEGAYYRPAETLLTIQFADQLTADGGELAGLIDVDRLAVMGHSSGGWTALIGGGAQMNLSGCPGFTSENPDAVWTWDCQNFAPQAEAIATMFGLPEVPTEAWPQQYDERVDAVITMAPDGDIWGAEYEGVATVTVPTMVMASSGDTGNIPEYASFPIYDHLGSALKSRVVFQNAEHPIVVDTCETSPWLIDLGLAMMCSDPVWDKDRALDLVNHFTTAFLLDVLYGDADAHAALLPEAVAFPGIDYQTTLQ